MIRISVMAQEDIVAWFPTMWADYYQELLGAGFTPEEATRNVSRNEKALCTDGLPNDDQYIFDVMEDDVKVGVLWLAEKKEEGHANDWFVYDIIIEEQFRGRGLGRGAMLAAEDFVKGRGGLTLGLNVFGPNAVARRLYESLGFTIMTIGMRKVVA